MRTKINNFYNLLNDLRYNFQKILNENPKYIDENNVNIESIYSRNKDLFPFEIKTLFEDLYAENPDKMKMLFWDNLKYSYYNLNEYIKLDYQFFKNPNFTILDNFKNLFYHSKTLSYNYFTYLSRIYYWYYGRFEKDTNKTIQVNYLSDYESINFNEIENYYSHQYEIIEKEVKYIYSKHTFTLEISEPKYTGNQELNSELEKLNSEHFLKLEILKDYNNKITELIIDIRFEYPNFLDNSETVIADNNEIEVNKKTEIQIRFKNPERFYIALSPFFFDEQKDELRKLLFNEIDYVENKLVFKGKAIKIAKFLRDYYFTKDIEAEYKTHLENWLINNFLYIDNENITEFTPSTVKSYMKSNINEIAINQPIILPD